MRFRYGGRTDVGPVRQHNEDDYRIDAERGVVIVADGMGGASSGDLASRELCASAARFLARMLDGERNEAIWPFAADTLLDERERLLVTTLRYAHQRVLVRTRQYFATSSATTGVVALFTDDVLTLAHAGDSLALRRRRGVVTPLVRTHSLIHEMFAMPFPLEDEARYGELPRNIITRGVGFGEDVHVEVGTWHVEAGDRYVLASDGLTEPLSPEAIGAVLAAHDAEPERAAHALVDAAIAAAVEDNITAVVVACDA
jgi:serine/threonine protein phosphatase PrpC